MANKIIINEQQLKYILLCEQHKNGNIKPTRYTQRLDESVVTELSKTMMLWITKLVPKLGLKRFPKIFKVYKGVLKNNANAFLKNFVNFLVKKGYAQRNATFKNLVNEFMKKPVQNIAKGVKKETISNTKQAIAKQPVLKTGEAYANNNKQNLNESVTLTIGAVVAIIEFVIWALNKFGLPQILKSKNISIWLYDKMKNTPMEIKKVIDFILLGEPFQQIVQAAIKYGGDVTDEDKQQFGYGLYDAVALLTGMDWVGNGDLAVLMDIIIQQTYDEDPNYVVNLTMDTLKQHINAASQNQNNQFLNQGVQPLAQESTNVAKPQQKMAPVKMQRTQNPLLTGNFNQNNINAARI